MNMEPLLETILEGDLFTKQEIVRLLGVDGAERVKLFEKAAAVKREHVEDKVYFRGLVEYSNCCEKDCYYCGIRRSNRNVGRYAMTEKEVLEAARYACQERYASMVIQAGESSSVAFTRRITRLLKKIGALSGNSMGITLSLGEIGRASCRERV